MMKSTFFLILVLLSILPHSNAGVLADSFSCLNPTNPNFFQICNLAFFPPSTNLSGTLSLAGSHDVLFQTTFPSLNTSQLVQSYFSPTLQRLAHLVKFDTLAIINPTLQINVGATQAFHFSAVVSLLNLQNIQIDLLAMKATTPNLLFGLSVPFSSFPIFINAFLPIDVSPIFDVFNGSTSSFSVVLTNSFAFDNIPELQPSYLTKVTGWDSNSINFYLNVSLSTGTNLISKFLRKFLPSTPLILVVSVSESAFQAHVGIQDIRISNSLVLASAGVGISINRTDTKPTFFLDASLQLTVSNYTLTFTGKLSFTPLDCGLDFSMAGVWVNAFGLSRLSFGNILLGGGITYEGVPSRFSIGAEIAIGMVCYDSTNTFIGNGYCLHGAGYAGVDITEPNNNFFYVQISALSIDVLLRALLGSQTTQKVVVPPILNQALSFPNGILASYALVDQTLPNLSIKAGYVFNGTISIFSASATVQMSYYIADYHFTLLAYASPINLGSVFSLTGGSANGGPIINIDVGLFPTPVFKVSMSASVTLLGISASVAIDINPDRLFFAISGPILYGLLYGDFAVQLINNNFQSGSFSIAANIRMNQAMFDLISFVGNSISASLNSAKNQVINSQGSVTQASQNVEAQKAKVCADISAKCGASLCSQTQTQCSLYGTKSVCTSTGQQCSGGWTTTCTSTARSCSRSLPWWLGWACAAWNTVCTGTSQVCGAWTAVCTGTAQVTDYATCMIKKDVCVAYNWVIDTSCKAACDVASAGLDTANAALVAANGVLTGVQKSLGGLAKAFDFVASKATTIFNIVNAGFSITMNASNKNGFIGGISVNINVIILGQAYQRTVLWNFSSMDAIKKAVVDDAMSQIKSIFVP